MGRDQQASASHAKSTAASASTPNSQSGHSSGRLSESKGKSRDLTGSDSFSSSQPQIPSEAHRSPYTDSSPWTTPSAYSPQQVQSSLPSGPYPGSRNPHPQATYQSQSQPQSYYSNPMTQQPLSRSRSSYVSTSRFEPPAHYEEDPRVHHLPPPIPARYSSHPNNSSHLAMPRPSYLSSGYPSEQARQTELLQSRSSNSSPAPNSTFSGNYTDRYSQPSISQDRSSWHQLPPPRLPSNHYDSRSAPLLSSSGRSFSGQGLPNPHHLNPIGSSSSNRDRNISDSFNHPSNQDTHSEQQQHHQQSSHRVPPSFISPPSPSNESTNRFGDRTLPPLNIALPPHTRHPGPR